MSTKERVDMNFKGLSDKQAEVLGQMCTIGNTGGNIGDEPD